MIYGIQTCSTCRQFKLPGELVRDISKKSGRHHRCVECDRGHHAHRNQIGTKQASCTAYRKRNPEKASAWRAVGKA